MYIKIASSYLAWLLLKCVQIFHLQFVGQFQPETERKKDNTLFQEGDKFTHVPLKISQI